MRYAVGFVNLFDGELIIEIVEAEHEVQAAYRHGKISEHDREVYDSLEEMRVAFADGDCLLEVVEID